MVRHEFDAGERMDLRLGSARLVVTQIIALCFAGALWVSAPDMAVMAAGVGVQSALVGAALYGCTMLPREARPVIRLITYNYENLI